MGQNTLKGATKGIKCQFLSLKNRDLRFFCHLNHGNHDTLFFFYKHGCQETQIKNPFGPI